MDWLAFTLALLILLGPALVYLTYARFLSARDRSPWKWLLAGLFVGGLASLIAGTLEGWVRSVLSLSYLTTIAVLAPVGEEVLKSLWAYVGWSRSKAQVKGEEAGLASGLGFGVVEAGAYAALAYAAGGLELALITILLRSIGGVAFHGSSAALEGYASAQGLKLFLGTLALMMLVHGATNVLTFILPGWWADAAAVAVGLGMFTVSEVILRETVDREKVPEPSTG